jgi:hypothetical protein
VKKNYCNGLEIFFFFSDKYFSMEQQNNTGQILVNAIYAFKAQNTDEVNQFDLFFKFKIKKNYPINFSFFFLYK